VKGFVTSRTSHLRQGLDRESWMIGLVLVHYTGGLDGTACMAQATENDVGLAQPVSPRPPAQTAVPSSNVSNHTKNLRCV